MMNRMRQDAALKKSDDVRRAREIAQLRKEGRKKEHIIKFQEADVRKREAVLKRRQEEVREII